MKINKQNLILVILLISFLIGLSWPMLAIALEKPDTTGNTVKEARNVVKDIFTKGPIRMALEKGGAAILDSTFKEIAKLMSYATQGIFYLLSLLVLFVGKLFDVIFFVEKYKDAPFVDLGWKAVRDTMNIFFSVILLIIAFATIMGRENYGLKKVLPNLIIAALLVNFSLVIAGAIVDVSQIFMHYFIEQTGVTRGLAGADPTKTGSLSATIAGGLDIGRLWTTPPEKNVAGITWGGIPLTGLSRFIASNTNFVLGTILILLLIFVLLAGVLMLLQRMLYLWFLMVIAPAAWVAYILPSTQQHWGAWWKNFLCWCFVGPVYAFFLYLTLLIIKKKAISKMFEDTLAGGADINSPFAVFYVNASFAMQYLIIIGLLIGSLIAAKSLGCGAGVAAVNYLTQTGQKLQKSAAAWGKEKALHPVQTAARSETFQKAARWMAKTPGLKYLGKPMLGAAETSRAVLAKDREKYRKKYGSWNTNNLQSALARSGGSEAVALTELLAGRKNGLASTEQFPQELIEQKLGIVNKLGSKETKDAILSSRPDLANKLGQNLDEVIRDLKDITKIQKEVLEQPDIIAALGQRYVAKGHGSVSEMKKLAEEAPGIAEQIISGAIIGNLQNVRQDILNYLAKSPMKSLLPETITASGEKANIEIVREQRGPQKSPPKEYNI